MTQTGSNPRNKCVISCRLNLDSTDSSNDLALGMRSDKGAGVELAAENHHLSPSQFVATALAMIFDD